MALPVAPSGANPSAALAFYQAVEETAQDHEDRIATVESTEAGDVPATRTITAGTGLTGGGDLSANRTLAADFGTGAGKITQGNDSRLSDSRSPSGSAGGDLTGTFPNPTLATVNSNTGAIGDASHSLALTIDAKGRVTAASASAIAIAESQVTNLSSDLAAKAPQAGDIRWYSANDFLLAAGAPTLASTGVGTTGIRTPNWALDPGAEESVCRLVRPPSWWATFDLAIWWTVGVAYTGTNVVWTIERANWVVGDSTAEAETAVSNTVAAPTTNLIAVTTLISGITNTTASATRLEVKRSATDVADDVNQDANLLGVLLTRAS